MTRTPNGSCQKPGKFLNEIESKQLLKQAGLTVTEPFLANSDSEAVAIACSLGYPVVLKVVSPDIIHKSDAGCVITRLTDPEGVRHAYNNMMSNLRQNYPEVAIDGISVQSQAPRGVEVIIGMIRDIQFGPAIMFGLGGVWVELLKDFSLRIAPLYEEDASEMIHELKGFKLLQGYRGQPAADTEIIEDWLLKVSELVMLNPSIKELDINPVFVYPNGAVAVDARVLLEDTPLIA
ncbi:MAG: acetate--CoA ligase family protein [Dehalococcoidales bacterium]|nr:acetate--CoA ligase family protein [Dehalococcoidales bacterium]